MDDIIVIESDSYRLVYLVMEVEHYSTPDLSKAWNKGGVLDCPICGSSDHTCCIFMPCANHELICGVWYCEYCDFAWENRLVEEVSNETTAKVQQIRTVVETKHGVHLGQTGC